VQSTKASLASNASEFEGQAVHALVVAPTAVKYFPDTQLMQEALPRSVLYVPAMHFVQVPPFGPLDPSSQMQSLCTTLPAAVLEFPGQVWQTADVLAPTAAENVLSGQFVHSASPLAILYLPATHSLHVPPSAPVNPELQVQSLSSLLASGELEFARHS